MSLQSQRRYGRVHQFGVLAFILIAFGFRIFFVERLPYDYDRSYPQGVGLTILHQLTQGIAPTALLHSESSNSGLTNPALTNYVFALIGFFDRSPYTATLITAALGAVVAALTYDLGRCLFGRRVGLIALAVVATSPWSAFFARGSWYTGFFEMSAVVPAWLLMKALMNALMNASINKPASTKKIAMGILSSAVLAHFYLVSFALAAQVSAVLFVARGQLRHKPRLLGLFIAAWLISFVFLGVVIAANRTSNIRPDGITLVYGNPSPEEQAKLAKPGLNLVTLTRFGSLVGGRWEGWLDVQDALHKLPNPGSLATAWLWAYRLRAFAIEVAAVIGFGLWLFQARTRPMIRLVLVWLLVPLLGQIVVTSVLPTFPANHQNLFLASPVSYLMVGCGVAALHSGLLGALKSLRAMQIAIRVVGMLSLCVMVCVPLFGWMADAQALRYPNPTPPPDAMPLWWQLRLGEVVRSQCAKLNAPENPFELTRLKMQYWAAGLMQDAGRVRTSADIHVANADAWQVSAQGGDCAIRASDQPSPPFAQQITLSDPELMGRVQVFRSLAPPAALDGELRTNTGWRLAAVDYPTRIRRGQLLTVSISWLIEHLPNEPFATWRYDAFIKLIGPDGKSVAQGDTPSVAGSAWVAGEYIQTATRFTIPNELAPGEYTIQLSLFDRNQSKNAAFFVAGSSEPTSSINRVVRVE